MKRRTAQRAAERYCAQKAAEVDVPVPFDLGEFCARLGKRLDQTIYLVPTAMKPGAPTGVSVHEGDTTYLYYERETSPFHQTSVVLHLAAQLVLAPTGLATVDRRLVPDLSPELIRLMLGTEAADSVAAPVAELFAFLVLKRARLLGDLRSPALRSARRLKPLWTALREAVPDSGPNTARRRRMGRKLRLYRRVIEIRDAELALRPYQDPGAARTARRLARQARLDGEERDATVTAAVLAHAMRSRSSGESPRRDVPKTGMHIMPNVDLVADTEWLAKVAHAFHVSPIVRTLCDRSPTREQQ